MKSQVWIPYVITTVILQVVTTHDALTNQSQYEYYKKDGHYIIGGIFNIYASSKPPCSGGIRSDKLSFIEAMTFVIESINNRSDLLPYIDLGYEIRIDCGNEDKSLWTMLTFVSNKVTAVVGTGRSSTSILAAKVGSVFSVPVVSYYATSDELSDSERFPFFFRTVPPDKFQVKVIVDILQHFNWKYIALFYSLDSYGIHGARQIIRQAEIFDICIATIMPVTIPPSKSEVEDIAEKLEQYDKVSVIVAFSVTDGARAILQAIRNFKRPRTFTFIGSDSWGPESDKLAEFTDLLVGGIFVEFYSELPSTFQEYYRQLPYNQRYASQWYKDKLREIAESENCTEWVTCSVPKVHWNTQQVISAVYAVAYAINASLQVAPQQNSFNVQPIDGRLLRGSLLDVSVPSEGTNNYLRFDENGEVPGKYQIKNWQFKHGEYHLVDIGKWDTLQEVYLLLDEGNIQWGTANGKVPTSLCIEECHPGYIEVPLERKCCWGCQKCNDYAIVVKANDSAQCLDCPLTEWPDRNFTTCVPITPSFLDYSDAIFVLSILGAGFGLVLTILAACGLCYYSEHSLIKASSKELCSINLTGLALICVVVILNLLRPTGATCVVTDLSISTAFCISFAPVLLKVNRIWRIFSLKPGEMLRFTSPKSQVILTTSVIILEVLIVSITMVFAPSAPDLLTPSGRKPHLEIFCRFGYGFLTACVYNSLIIVVCCYYAFRARRVPDNFNESKFIAISVYSTLIVCLAALPVYSTANNVSQKIGALNAPLLVNTYTSLFCLYLPKIYAIHFPSAVQDMSMRSSFERQSSVATSQMRFAGGSDVLQH
ncbi:metabotropic glutamate receptor-like [Amphiura filiformis]|uniref:metabotropic glutamate receptor-like n=1 Tax=Amphiura filiformis TaxID=82378 RepID=UPI003B21F9C3